MANEIKTKRHHFCYGILSIVAVVTVALSAPLPTTAATAVSTAIQYERDLALSQGADGVPRPTTVSVDQTSGEICVTDAKRPAFHIFNARGVEIFHTNALSGLSAPKSSIVDSRGAVVFTDSPIAGGLPTVRRLSAFGEPEAFELESPDPNWAPRFVTITRDRNYLTMDAAGGVLAKHDARNGELLWEYFFGGEESREMHLGAPLEAPDGRIYLPGGELHQILVFSAEGEQLESFGKFGTGRGKLVLPVGVAAGPAGTLLVLDRLRGKVLVYDEDRTFLTEFGGMGFGPGQFYHPLSIASGPEGRFYVAQQAQGRVQVFHVAIHADGS